jgi:hypothetical protein
MAFDCTNTFLYQQQQQQHLHICATDWGYSCGKNVIVQSKAMFYDVFRYCFLQLNINESGYTSILLTKEFTRTLLEVKQAMESRNNCVNRCNCVDLLVPYTGLAFPNNIPHKQISPVKFYIEHVDTKTNLLA